MALKAHQIALDVNEKEDHWFRQQCGYARFAYNAALSDFKAGLGVGEFRSFFTLNNRFNKKKRTIAWTQEMDQRAALYGINHLSDAIKRWKSKQNRFPKFKKRGCRQSYTVEGAVVRIAEKHDLC